MHQANPNIHHTPREFALVSTTLQELEGLTYPTTLDLNMGYYTIRLDPTAAEVCTLIFPWGKYSYQRLPMGFSGSADIFQAEMGNLMVTLEYVQAYIDILLVITKGSLDDHLDKLKQVFIQLCNAGLKINVAKLFFCAQETEYLGYILTRGGIESQPKKVQAILLLNPPNNVKELDNCLVWSNTIEMCGRNVVKCWPLSPIWWESAERLKPPRGMKPKRNFGKGNQSINRHMTT